MPRDPSALTARPRLRRFSSQPGVGDFPRWRLPYLLPFNWRCAVIVRSRRQDWLWSAFTDRIAEEVMTNACIVRKFPYNLDSATKRYPVAPLELAIRCIPTRTRALPQSRTEMNTTYWRYKLVLLNIFFRWLVNVWHNFNRMLGMECLSREKHELSLFKLILLICNTFIIPRYVLGVHLCKGNHYRMKYKIPKWHECLQAYENSYAPGTFGKRS